MIVVDVDNWALAEACALTRHKQDTSQLVTTLSSKVSPFAPASSINSGKNSGKNSDINSNIKDLYRSQVKLKSDVTGARQQL